MLCSISTRKSGSNWLDRLRSAKGFPVENGRDLEHFLHTNPNLAISDISGDIPADNSPEKKTDLPPCVDKPRHDRKSNSDQKAKIAAKNEDWFEIMSSVLARLFNMGDPQRVRDFDEKKSSRKQLNPKICVLADSTSFNGSCFAGAPRSDGVLALSPSSVENSGTEAKESDGGLMVPGKHCGSSVDFKEEVIHSDLSLYSRAEVTVIDTSTVNWKSEKVIFRKGNVWKIRDKKRRSSCISVKKRKLGEFDKLLGDKVEQLSSLPPLHACKEADCNKRLHSSKEGSTHTNKRKSLKETSNDLSQNPERRQVCLEFTPNFRSVLSYHSSPEHLVNLPTEIPLFSEVLHLSQKMVHTAQKAASKIHNRVSYCSFYGVGTPRFGSGILSFARGAKKPVSKNLRGGNRGG